MAEKNDSTVEQEFEKVRGRLQELNKKIKGFSSYHPQSARASEKQSTHQVRHKIIPSEVSLEEMHSKLHTINDYLKKRLAGEKVRMPAFPVAQEIVHEQVQEPMEEVADEIKVDREQTTTLTLPTFGESRQKEADERVGVGLDLGTAYIVAAREVEHSRVFVKNERNAYISVRNDKATQELLTKLKIKYAVLGDKMYVLGNLALELASIFNRETQRSMMMGILNPSESESIPILKLLVENILWKPRQRKELCCFSIPAAPIDRDQDTIYHRGVFEGILRNIGFEPMIIDEGYAVVLSELQHKDFTGIGVSCGAGMVNICAAYKSVPIISFSITRGGDWVDKSAAAVLGVPSTRVTAIKEQGLRLTKPAQREEEAIAIYYRHYIHYFLENMAQVFGKSANKPKFKDPVDIIFAGGSSMVGDFSTIVEEELQSIDMGFEVGTVKLAQEAFTSVSRGCLFNAINHSKQQ